MTRQYWLVKQEPESYSWDDFAREGTTSWTGVRNFQARNNLRAMRKGDLVFFYASGEDRQVVGLAKVARAHYPDPTAEEGDWSSVDLEAVRAVPRAVSLSEMKANPRLSGLALIKHSRLSVVPVSEEHANIILELAFEGRPKDLERVRWGN